MTLDMESEDTSDDSEKASEDDENQMNKRKSFDI